MTSRFHSALVLALVACALLAGLFRVVPRASAGAAIVFGEDFESGVLDARFTVFDSNTASGLDYWGISGYRANGGQYSAWGAQVGTQSTGPLVGQDNAAPGVQTYDDNMDADLVVDLRVNGFASLTLSFFYFIRTENGGGDWIQAWYEAGGIQTNIFDPRGSTGNSWASVSLNVPNNIERLIIRFHTDTANNGFEGAYVDDIVLTGIEDIPPTSSVSALATYSNDDPFPVPFAAQDNANASGVQYVELWYRHGGSGSFVQYTPEQNRLGHFVISPITFEPSQAQGDGFYEFYTIAVDYAGNAEDPPGSPDASVTIDTVGPEIEITNPQTGSEVSTDSIHIEWTGSDDRSGIDHYEISLDGVGFVSTGTASSRDYTGLAPGEHTVVVRAYDRAGNVREATVTFTTGTQPAGFPWWILALVAAIILGSLLFLVWWKRRKDRQAPGAVKPRAIEGPIERKSEMEAFQPSGSGDMAAGEADRPESGESPPEGAS